jgi:selenocysteine-specific elongation factor
MLCGLAEDFNPVSLLAALIHDRGILSASGLFELSQMDKNIFSGSLDELSRMPDAHNLMEFGKSRIFISGAAFDKTAKAAVRILKKFHAEYPELAGLDAEKLYSSLDSVQNSGKISSGDFKDLIGIIAAKKIISAVTVQGKTCYRCVDFSQSPDDKLMAFAESIRALISSTGFNLLTLAEIEEKLGANPQDVKRAAAYLREKDGLRIIDGGLLFSRQMREKLLAVLASMNEDITVASLRDTLGVSRKYTLPMLDFLDSQGLTQRIGDKRILVKSEESG